MIDIYAINTRSNSGKIKIQAVPAGSEDGVKILAPTTKGDIGNAESMDFSVQNGTPYYDEFYQLKTYIQVDYDGETIFYGRVLTINEGFYGEQKIHCEGAIAFLNDSYYPATPKNEKKSLSILNYMTAVINNHNSQLNDPLKSIYLGEVPGKYTSVTSSEQRIENASREFGQTSWNSTKSALEDLKNHYGGAFRVRYVNGKCYLDWLNHYYRSTVNSQTIEVGKNLLDVSRATEISNVFTAIIPIGKSSSGDSAIYITGYRTDLHSGNYLKVPEICKSVKSSSFYTDAELNSGYHKAEDYKTAVERYGLIFKTVDFQEAHSQADLLAEAAKWVKNNYQGGVTTFTVKAIDLHLIGENTGKIMLGDRVKIRYPVGSNSTLARIEERILTCTSVQYDLFNPESNQYTFGIPANMLSKTYGDNSSQKKTTQSAYKGTKVPETEYQTETNWMDSVRKWLREHQLRFKSSGNVERGNTHTGDTQKVNDTPLFGYFIEMLNEPDGDGHRFVIWPPLVKIIYPGGGADPIKSFEKYSDNGWKRFVTPIIMSYATYCDDDALLRQINACYLFEYIYIEYGIDLRGDNNDLTFKMPKVTIDSQTGETTIWQTMQTGVGTTLAVKGITLLSTMASAIGGEDETPFMRVSKFLTDAAGNLLTDLEGNPIIQNLTQIGNDGTMQFSSLLNGLPTEDLTTYAKIDPESQDITVADDEGQPISVRNLKFRADVEENFRGSIVDTGLTDEQGHAQYFRMGQEIVKAGTNGEAEDLVYAYVEGDIVKIGNRLTRSIESIAKNVNGVYVPFRGRETDAYGNVNMVELKTGVEAHRGYYDATTGEFVELATISDMPPHGEEVISFVRTGMWNEKLQKFVGGLTVGPDPDDPTKTVAYLQSSRLVIGNGADERTIIQALKDAGVIDENERSVGLVSNAVYTNKIRAIDAKFNTIETDYLNADWVSSMVASVNLLNVKSITGTGATSNASFYSFNSTGNKYYLNFSAGQIGPSATNRNLADGIYRLKLDGPTNNVYTLSYYTYLQNVEGGTPTVVGTFSRAISAFSSSWGGGTSVADLTIGTTPQNQNYVLYLAREKRKNGSLDPYTGTEYYYWNGTTVYLPIASYNTNNSTISNYTSTTLKPSISVANLISGVSSEAFIDTDSSNMGMRTTITARAMNSEGTVLKTGTYTLSEGTVKNPNDTIRAYDVLLKQGDTIVGKIITSNAYSGGVTDGTNAVTASPAYAATFDNPTFNEKTSFKIVSKTSTNKTNDSTSLTLSKTTYTIGTSGMTNHCVEVKEGSTLRARINTESVYTDGTTAGVNSVTASPAYAATFDNPTFNEKTSFKIVSKTSTNKTNDSTSLTLSKTTYTIGTSGTTNHCVEVKEGSTLRARINTESVYTDGVSAGTTAGVNSVTASAATCESWADPAMHTKTDIVIISKASNGKTNNSTSISLSSTTYDIDTNGTKNYCVELKEGQNLRGRINTQATYTAGNTAGVNSVTASAATCESWSNPSMSTKTSIKIISKASNGKTNNSTSISLSGPTTYTISTSGTTQHCVELKEGSSGELRGRINIESTYRDGYVEGWKHYYDVWESNYSTNSSNASYKYPKKYPVDKPWDSESNAEFQWSGSIATVESHSRIYASNQKWQYSIEHSSNQYYTHSFTATIPRSSAISGFTEGDTYYLYH